MVYIQHSQGLVSVMTSSIKAIAIICPKSRIALEETIRQYEEFHDCVKLTQMQLMSDFHLKDICRPLDNLCQVSMGITSHVTCNPKTGTKRDLKASQLVSLHQSKWMVKSNEHCDCLHQHQSWYQCRSLPWHYKAPLPPTWANGWISSIKRTSPGFNIQNRYQVTRFSMTGPDVCLRLTPSSLATTKAMVVFPETWRTK